MRRSLSRSNWGVFHSRLHIFVVGRGRQRARDQLNSASGDGAALRSRASLAHFTAWTSRLMTWRFGKPQKSSNFGQDTSRYSLHNSKQRHPVIYLGVFPEPSACLAAAAPLKATQECCLAIRRIPNPRPCAAVERICWRSRKRGPGVTPGHPLMVRDGLKYPDRRGGGLRFVEATGLCAWSAQSELVNCDPRKRALPTGVWNKPIVDLPVSR